MQQTLATIPLAATGAEIALYNIMHGFNQLATGGGILESGSTIYLFFNYRVFSPSSWILTIRCGRGKSCASNWSFAGRGSFFCFVHGARDRGLVLLVK